MEATNPQVVEKLSCAKGGFH